MEMPKNQKCANPIYRETRDQMLEGHSCASTMLVCGVASEVWKVEIAVKAGKVG